VRGVDVEIITQLERVSLTPALDSDYYNFAICSLSQGS
jgi:hypothetical protein